MTPVSAAMRGRSFMMLSYLLVSSDGAMGKLISSMCNKPCHPERSEGAHKRSRGVASEVLRSAQNDNTIHEMACKIFWLSTDLPTVIEIVDSEEKVNEFLPKLEQM